MFRKKTVRDVEVAGKTVLVRVDYNVPMDGGAVADDMRIRASLPTIKYLLENGAGKLILISHMGRPEGEVRKEFSLAPVADRLGKLLSGREVRFFEALFGETVREAVADLPKGGVLLLENLRFSPEEEADSEDFARRVIESCGAELFVQDGFAVIHRAHASTDAMARLLPAVAGLLVEDEVTRLEGVMTEPERPLLVIIGGAKVDDKKPLVEKFLPLADMIAVGGKIAAEEQFLADEDKVYVAEDFVTNEQGVKLDIGEKSVAQILEMIDSARTVVWNGTLGMVEDERFAAGSLAVARALGLSEGRKTTIIGGGDTAGFVEKLVREDPSLHYSLISTGGGASLELLSGKKLPGLEVLL